MEYKFMQIYGSCAATHFLGKDRLRGPVDNVITKGYKCIELLLNNEYTDYLIDNKPIIAKRTPNYEGDSTNSYTYDFVEIVHQNPLTGKYIDEIKNRINNFNDFLKNINKDNYYFVYSLNIWDMNNKTHKLNSTIFEENIKYLKNKKLLNKTIFIGTKNNNWWNFWSNDLIPLIKKYNLKYIEITDMGMGICDDTATINQFKAEVIKVIKYGTDKKYYYKRTKEGKFIIPKPKPKPKQSYIGINNYFGL